MKFVKMFFSVATVVVCTAGACRLDAYQMQVRADDNLVFDYSEIEENPQLQFYYSDENEFYIDGITVYSDSKDVTDDVKFTFNTSPKSTYNGKNIDYTVPFIAEYDDKAAEGQLDVKIGMRGDANCDHQITANDLVLIQNDLLQTYSSGKTALTAHDGLGIFLANADGRQLTSEGEKPYYKNMLNIGDAFFVSTYLNGKGSGSMYRNITVNNVVKPRKGTINISERQGAAGKFITVPVSLTSDKTLGAFEFECKWSGGLIPVGAFSVDDSATVFDCVSSNSIRIWGFGNKDSLESGETVYLKFKIPDNAIKNTKYNIAVSEIGYFGTDIDISSSVTTDAGSVTVGSVSSDPDDFTPEYDEYEYNYGIKVWDTAVEYGETSAQLPVMLLGGLETTGFKMTVTCDAPLTVSELYNAVSATGTSTAGGITGIYENENGIPVDFETLEVTIKKSAEPGKYPVNIVIEDIKGANSKKVTVFSGSVTIKDEPAVKGDANEDGRLTVRDCALIANKLSKGKVSELPSHTDFNSDGKINVRDAAAIAKSLAKS